MTKLPVLDCHDIWLRSAGYIWHVFVVIGGILDFLYPIIPRPGPIALIFTL